MKRDKIICAIALAALSLQTVSAEVLDKEVTVTRAYTPTVGEATKLTLTPDTSDNTYIKPDIDYSITPISIGTTFNNDLYSPTQMSFGKYDPYDPFYVKLGVGLPLNSVVDLYASSVDASNGYIMGYVNQDGRFAKIENDYGEKSGSSQNHMRVGVAGGLYRGNKTLDGALNYNYDRWSRYATSTLYDTNPLYQDIEFRGRYGDNFLNLERFNFAIEADAKYFWSRSDVNSMTLGASGSFGYRILNGDVVFSLGYNNISGSDDYNNDTFMAALSYGYSNDKLALGLGFRFYSDNVDLGEDKTVDGLDKITNYFLPVVNLDYKVNDDKVTLYFAADGEFRYNDFATLSGINPYLSPELIVPKSSLESDIDLGLKGRAAGDKFGYNIHVGFTYIKNNLYWAYYQMTDTDSTENMFLASYSDQHNINVNVDLEYKPLSDLLLQFGISHANYTNDRDQQYADGVANTKLRFAGEYNLSKLSFGLNAQLLSSRECGQIIDANYSTVEIPTTFDMGASVDYRYKDNFVIFADVNNIFNSDIYNWVYYREYGINFVAGVKIKF
ncbi:MAG: hypothetical protein SNH55_07350 [Rikenellaceae bacterium]